ncbi:hypothetical protein [Polluticaenibacter yanchengensis]|uniref:Uncharacterized protein n=1 Tax=Polluticaenibacter yanchengensis TaxID=3014562 RepID=A0ABT4UFP4_9BACT|nr:hypothetical protein [Chitinophagaceae bacterium LY-5]
MDIKISKHFWLVLTIALLGVTKSYAQTDSLKQDTLLKRIPPIDTPAVNVPTHIERVRFIDSTFRILNLNPYITLHVDSSINYQFKVNREDSLIKLNWFLRNSPVGMRIDRNTGMLVLKADKNLFRSGRLKYDQQYKVLLGVQNIDDPSEFVDTSFTIVFYNTEIIASKIRPTISDRLFVEEGDTVRFKIQCEEGTFPIEQITMKTNIPIYNYVTPHKCDDTFLWTIPYDFIKDDDTAKQKKLFIQFIGADKFFNKDTGIVELNIRPGLNYPYLYNEFKSLSDEYKKYILSLKLTFYVLSKSVKSTKNTRTTFDISSSTTALAGTILSTSGTSGSSTQTVGKILPSVGLTLVPVKEAVAPSKVQEQNTATQVRTVAKRLEYLLSENRLIGEKDPQTTAKIKKLNEELKNARNQLVDLPLVEFDESFTPTDAEKYFNDPKVNKNYKLKLK